MTENQLKLPALADGYCRFYIFRHGKSEGNLMNLLQGQKDYPLTQEGVAAAEKVCDLLAGENFSEIFASDLSRARQTAEIIASAKHLAVKATYLLRDQTYGIFDGMEKTKFKEELRQKLAEHEALTVEEQINDRLAPGAETDAEVLARLLNFLRFTALANSNKKILVISHSNVVRDLLVKFGYCVKKQLPSGSIKNLAYFVLDSNGSDFNVVGTHNIQVSPA
ncbi:MAG: histidine phosphatase family protein [bacterium]|nr:histidine phosphatase family protein [bacterium]